MTTDQKVTGLSSVGVTRKESLFRLSFLHLGGGRDGEGTSELPLFHNFASVRMHGESVNMFKPMLKPPPIPPETGLLLIRLSFLPFFP